MWYSEFVLLPPALGCSKVAWLQCATSCSQSSDPRLNFHSILRDHNTTSTSQVWPIIYNYILALSLPMAVDTVPTSWQMALISAPLILSGPCKHLPMESRKCMPGTLSNPNPILSNKMWKGPIRSKALINLHQHHVCWVLPKKYLPVMDKYIMVIPACPHWCAGQAPDEKLKINELGLNLNLSLGQVISSPTVAVQMSL